MIWFTSDTHFGHRNISEFCRRPFSSVEEMDAELIRRWNVVVKPNDTVYHLGDFSFKHNAGVPFEWYYNQLNGRKVIILGNHDIPNVVRRHCYEVYDTLYLRHNGLRFFLSHYAHRVWRNSHRGSFHLYGHSHGELPGFGRSMDVGIDAVMGYAPISLDEVVAKLEALPDSNHHPMRNGTPNPV